ncbi:hypothetical protein [Streptomyces sp. LBL]|uniref:hypothetical protein n=1 Tax=Streptomyces sp. LBL TaxID=2940562 RepID=UPI0024758A0E|nr:hypothetical protein [Streptomyces sp. LBL]
MSPALPALRPALVMVALFALTAAAPAEHPVDPGWVLAGFATAAALAGVPLCLVVRRRRTTDTADQVRGCGP